VLADRLVRRTGVVRDMLKVPLIALPLAAPFAAGFVLAPTVVLTLLCAAGMNFCLTCAAPPCINFAITRTDPGDRGVTATIMLAATGLIGGGLGPFVVGALSDILEPRLGAESLRYAIASLILTPAMAAAFLAVAMRKSGEPVAKAGQFA
jgi:MFS family permease